MAFLHDAQVRASIRQRISGLKPDATRRWGRMTVDQMLHHVNVALESALGRLPVAPLSMPLPKSVLKFMVLHVPWPRGAPTPPEWMAGARYDFEAERARCLALIDELTAKPLDGPWPKHSTFDHVTGKEYSTLQAKHLDHHLRQFSA